MNSSIYRVLGNKSFLFLWLAEVFSQVAMNMANFVLVIVTYELSDSTAAVTGIVFAFLIPSILFGIPAGVYVDRWNKRNVLFVTTLIRALILFLLVGTYGNIGIVFGLTFAIALATQFFIPAETPMIPLVVKREDLLSANALFGMGLYGSILVAYALSGPFVILFGKTIVFAVLGCMFLLASLFIMGIKVPGKEHDEMVRTTGRISDKTNKTIMLEMVAALRMILKTKEIFQSLFLLILSQILILVMIVIGPEFATKVLRIDVEKFPLLFVTPAAIGLIIGAIIVSRFFASYPRHKIATIGVMLTGITIFLLSHGSTIASRGFVKTINTVLPPVFDIDVIHTVIALAFMLGFANALVFVAANTNLQEQTADHIRGKVYGALSAFTGIFSIIPLVIVAVLAHVIGLRAVMQILGGSVFFIGILRFLIK